MGGFFVATMGGFFVATMGSFFVAALGGFFVAALVGFFGTILESVYPTTHRSERLEFSAWRRWRFFRWTFSRGCGSSLWCFEGRVGCDSWALRCCFPPRWDVRTNRVQGGLVRAPRPTHSLSYARPTKKKTLTNPRKKMVIIGMKKLKKHLVFDASGSIT